MRKSPTLAAILENATDGFQIECSCNRGCATHNEEVSGWWKVQELTIETLEAQTSNPIARQPCSGTKQRAIRESLSYISTVKEAGIGNGRDSTEFCARISQ